jgi:hypothetical protein
VATTTRQLDLDFQGRLWLAADALRAANVAPFRELVASLDAIAARTRLPLQRWYALVMLAQQAAIEGRLDEAERLTEDAGSLGERLGTELASAYRLGQRCVLRRERGGLGGLAVEIEQLSARLPYFVTSIIRRPDRRRRRTSVRCPNRDRTAERQPLRRRTPGFPVGGDDCPAHRGRDDRQFVASSDPGGLARTAERHAGRERAAQLLGILRPLPRASPPGPR